jgi:AcrR family transcriptional regulator
LIFAEGLSALSIANVRQAASVSGSQMAHYFANKDSLVRAVITHQTQAILDFHRQPALRGLDTVEDFERWVELTLRLRRKGRVGVVPSYGALCAEIDNYDEKTRKQLAEGQRQWADLLENGLQRMKAGGPRLGVNRCTITKWRNRFSDMRCDDLLDEPRPSRSRMVDDAAIEALIAATLETAPTDAKHWSTQRAQSESGRTEVNDALALRTT